MKCFSRLSGLQFLVKNSPLGKTVSSTRQLSRDPQHVLVCLVVGCKTHDPGRDPLQTSEGREVSHGYNRVWARHDNVMTNLISLLSWGVQSQLGLLWPRRDVALKPGWSVIYQI